MILLKSSGELFTSKSIWLIGRLECKMADIEKKSCRQPREAAEQVQV
jgi:hypothetical protein